MADKKITSLTALTEPAGEDLLLIVDDPAGTPVSRRVTLNDVFGATTVGGTPLSKLSLNVSGTSDITSTGATTITSAGLTIASDVTLTSPAFSSTNTTFDVTTTTSDIEAGTSITLDSPSLVITEPSADVAVSVAGRVEATKTVRAQEHLVVGAGSIPTFGAGVPAGGVIVLPVNTEPSADNIDGYPAGSVLVGETGGSYYLYIVTTSAIQANAIKRVGFTNY